MSFSTSFPGKVLPVSFEVSDWILLGPNLFSRNRLL